MRTSCLITHPNEEYIFVSLSTYKAAHVTYNCKLASHVNYNAYTIMRAGEYLGRLNRNIAKGITDGTVAMD